MIKAVYLITFRDDVPYADVSRHWRTSHGQIALKVPKIQRYIQNHLSGELDSEQAPGGLRFQGIVECWFDDYDAFVHATTSPEWTPLREDEAAVFQSHLFQGGFVDEYVWRWEGLADGPTQTAAGPG